MVCRKNHAETLNENVVCLKSDEFVRQSNKILLLAAANLICNLIGSLGELCKGELVR